MDEIVRGGGGIPNILKTFLLMKLRLCMEFVSTMKEISFSVTFATVFNNVGGVSIVCT